MNNTDVPHVEYDLDAYADGVFDGVLTGWAANRARKDDILMLELRCDGRSIATFAADRPRAGGLENAENEGNHGFQVTLPPDMSDGQIYELTVFAIESGKEVARVTWQHEGNGAVEPAEAVSDGVEPVSAAMTIEERDDTPPVAAPAAVAPEPEIVVSTLDVAERAAAPAPQINPMLGQLDSVEERQFFGWAFDPQTPDEPAELQVLVDGVAKRLIIADKSRPDVAQAGIGTGNNGFADQLPDICFDGDEHVVEIVAARSGQLLIGGGFKVKVSMEGVAFLDRNAPAIAGWARNAKSVVVAFDNGRSFTVPTGMPVPGFAPGDQLGFRLPIPPDMLDGRWHTATVRYGNVKRLLDGNPIAFRLTAPAVTVSVTGVSGRRISGIASDSRDPDRQIMLAIEVDGALYARIRADRFRAAGLPGEETRIGGLFSFTFPASARYLAIREADLANAPILAHWRLDGEIAAESDSHDLSIELSAEALADPALTTAVSERFARFLAEPGEDFDAGWYLINHPQAAQAIAEGKFPDALSHFAALGGREALSPSPYFDEAFVRRSFPMIDNAVAAGRLVSAFALYLHLGKGAAFDPIEGFDAGAYIAAHADAEGTNPLMHAFDAPVGIPVETETPDAADTAPLTRPLPRPLRHQDASENIYTAWIDRLSMDAKVVPGLIAQEADMRAFVGSTVLLRAPLVSIIMPTFNRAFTIGEAIQSALNQTYENWELIICDDASTDRTPMVVAQFQDPRIRYMQFEKSNGAGTRNKGLRFARGEYIAYLDSDNLWDPLFLDVMIRHLLDRPGQPMAYAGYFDTEIVGAKVTLQNIALPHFNPIQLSNRNFIDLNTIVHHRHLYEWIGGFDESLLRLQDWDLALQFTSVFNPIFVPYCLVYYRRNVAWGQVTHLFLDQNVKSTVADKTERRLNRHHVKLKIAWPDRPHLTLIAEGAGNIAAARSFAVLASDVADVTLVCTDEPGMTFETAYHVVRVPKERFGQPSLMTSLLANLPNAAAIVGFGIEAFAMRRLMANAAMPAFVAVVRSTGIALESVTDARLSFFVGALPLTAIAPFHLEESLPNDDDVFAATIFPFKDAATDVADLARLTIGRAFTLHVAPADPFGGRWATLSNGMAEWMSGTATQALETARNQSRFIIAATPLQHLSLSAFNFVFDRMGAGTTALLRPDGFGGQMVESGAAYRIDVAAYDWILDKVPKLRNAASSVASFREKSAKCYRIQMHPELVQERIAYFVHQVAYSALKFEVGHVA